MAEQECHVVLRRLFAIAVLACSAHVAPAHAVECDARCASYVEGVLRAWNDAVQVTRARQWYGWQWYQSPHSQCVISHESRYAGLWVASNGSHFGAYQFSPSTWDVVAGWRNRPDLVGVRPDSAPWWEQSLQYAALFARDGDAPWGYRCDRSSSPR